MGYNNRSSHGPYAPPALDGLSLAMGSKSNSASKIQVDHARIEAAVREILCAVGENPDREGLLETPSRVARMYEEIFAGLREDPRKHMQKTFAEKYDEMVLVRDITFASCCEHHLLPFRIILNYTQSPTPAPYLPIRLVFLELSLKASFLRTKS